MITLPQFPTSHQQAKGLRFHGFRDETSRVPDVRFIGLEEVDA